MRLIPTCATLLLASLLATPVLAAEPAMDDAARMQYALGYQPGRDLVAIEPRPPDLLKGADDGRPGGRARPARDFQPHPHPRRPRHHGPRPAAPPVRPHPPPPPALPLPRIAAALRPEGLNLGTSLRQSKNLVITGLAGGLVVTLYDAVMTAAPAVWGATASRAGEVTFEASRKLDGSGASGTLGAVFEIAIAS